MKKLISMMALSAIFVLFFSGIGAQSKTTESVYTPVFTQTFQRISQSDLEASRLRAEFAKNKSEYTQSFYDLKRMAGE